MRNAENAFAAFRFEFIWMHLVLRSCKCAFHSTDAPTLSLPIDHPACLPLNVAVHTQADVLSLKFQKFCHIPSQLSRFLRRLDFRSICFKQLCLLLHSASMTGGLEESSSRVKMIVKTSREHNPQN